MRTQSLYHLRKNAKPNELIPLIAMGIIRVTWSSTHARTELHIELLSLTQANVLLRSTCSLTTFQGDVLRYLCTDSELIVTATGRAPRISRSQGVM